ncbi:Serine threonine- kinase SCH9 [Lecanosticta acicola]|uniref:non-specific serine/threonine protein kinase n=1 Tax=Lecanosticta acicola TaxID=111012 RepID=A0AAI8Z3T0_9PEZI|nr:Serine threonine- kinase SCH9 [Lecanosticta acicola]
MASADTAHVHSRMHHDDDHASDDVDSRSTSPPNGGTSTPRPDLLDKRLPGIVNSYFAQVCDTLRLRSNSAAVTANSAAAGVGGGVGGGVAAAASPAPEPDMISSDEKEPPAVAALSQALAGSASPTTMLPTAPNSPPMSGASSAQQVESPPLPPSEKKQKQKHEHEHQHHHHHQHQHHPDLLSHSTTVTDPRQQAATYPTPPLSNSSSFLAMNDVEAGSDGASATPFSRKRSWGERKKSQGHANVPSQLRRNTLSSALSNVVITEPAVAAHISNPSFEASQTAPASTSVLAPSSSPPRSQEWETQLTQASDSQNTPPQTPRSGSHASRSKDDDIPHTAKSSRSGSGGSQAATVGQLRGQLEICVEEGRGLRPAVDPYVVAIFQLNEDISGGPKEDEMDTQPDNASPEENLAKGVAMKRLGSGQGTPMAIPGLRSRQTSSTNIADLRRGSHQKSGHQETTDPVWRHRATFDVVGSDNELDISVYDRANSECFIGHVRLPIDLNDYEHQHEEWFKLQPREGITETVTGELHLRLAFHAAGKKTFGPDDFEILKLIGKGTFGQVFQVRKKDTKRIYAMKVLSKKVIVQKKEIQHTIGERNILVRTATTESPFIVGLKFSFQTAADLYLVTDYMSGGELFWHLQKEGRFVEERAKFYIAELILALRHLHQHDIVYRDLKPENILLDANGHIALCDFGLSKANLSKNDTTNTFCGTTEYLAPEVLLDEQGYTKMVDFWSLGVLVFEMCCGWSPFYAEDTQQMYKNIAFGKVRFPRDALSAEGRSFVKGLLNRNPSHRLGAKADAEELMAHPFFSDVDWNALSEKKVAPPFKPKLKGELDTSNFDPEFTNALTAGADSSSLNARAAALASGIGTDSTPLSPTMQNQFKGFTFVDESTLEQQYADRDLDSPEMGGSASRTFSNRAGDRMSGLEPTGATSADGDFNHGMLDDI